MARIDTTDEGKGFVPIEQAMYPFTIVSVEEKKSKAKNNMFAIELEIVAGQHKGEKVKDWIMLDGRAVGWGTAKLTAILARDINHGDEIMEMDLQGAEVWAYLGHEEYEGRDGKTYTSYRIDGRAGPGECGYVSKSSHPWPTTDSYTPPGLEPDEHSNDSDSDGFETIPFD